MTDTTEPPSDDRGSDPLSQLRDIPSRYREALAASSEGGEERPAEARDLPAEAVEEAAHTRDLLDAAARRVERLLEDTRPLGDPGDAPPKRGPYGLDADVVLEVLDTNAERLAQLVETVPEHAAERDPAVREGLKSISGELVNEAVTESERRLEDVRRAVDDDS